MHSLSAIIVNYNSGNLLELCINSIIDSDSIKEVIVVDNSSEFLKIYNHKKIKYLYLDHNYGFASGVNIGVLNAKYDDILVINSDAKLTFDEIDIFIDVSKNLNYCISQPKISDIEGILSDGCGTYLDTTYSLIHNNYHGNLNSNINYEGRVFSIKGSVFFIDRKIFNLIGGMDSDYWCYWEETDLCHRSQIYGFNVGFVNLCKFSHIGGYTSNKSSKVKVHSYNFANKLTSHLKNLEFKNLPSAIIWHFVISGIFSLLALFIKRDLKVLLGYIFSLFIVMSRFKKIITKRNIIQKNRKKSDLEIFRMIGKNISISYYYNLFRNFK